MYQNNNDDDDANDANDADDDDGASNANDVDDDDGADDVVVDDDDDGGDTDDVDVDDDYDDDDDSTDDFDVADADDDDDDDADDDDDDDDPSAFHIAMLRKGGMEHKIVPAECRQSKLKRCVTLMALLRKVKMIKVMEHERKKAEMRNRRELQLSQEESRKAIGNYVCDYKHFYICR